MDAPSKDVEESPKSNPLAILGPAIFVSVLSFASTLPLRPLILSQILGDGKAVSMMLARITASGALSEFIFNPLFGRAMDTHGRKPFLIGAMLASAAAYGLAFLNAGNANVYLIETIIRKASDTVFFTGVRTAMTDSLSGPELTISAARIATFAGCGVMVGPILSQRVFIELFKLQPKHMFLVNVGVLGATAAVLAATFRETLNPEHKKPMDWVACNPLNFVRLLKASRSMFMLMITSGLQTCIDGYNIVESNFIYQRDQLDFSAAQQSNYLTFAGVKIIMGGVLGKPMMRFLGQLGLTTFSNFANFTAQAIGMLASGPIGMYTHVLATGFGERKRDGVETLATAEATRLGFGRGETTAGLSNFRSLSNISSPILYAAVYNWGAAHGFPKALFLARMLVGAIIPELTFRLIPHAERLRLTQA